MFVGHGEEGQVPGERRRRRGRVGGVGGGGRVIWSRLEGITHIAGQTGL